MIVIESADAAASFKRNFNARFAPPPALCGELAAITRLETRIAAGR
jgi:hypothetical protein